MRPRSLILSYHSDLGLGVLAHEGVVGDALEGGELVQDVNDRRLESVINQFSPFFTSDCYEKNAFWWRHLAPKKVAPNINVSTD